MLAATGNGTRYFSSGMLRFSSARYFATLNIGNMNAKGPGPAAVRNEVIGTFLATKSPHLMFFQEFTKLGPLTKKWEPYQLKPSYRYFGDSQASILYDSEVLELHPLSMDSMDILDEGNDLVTSRLAICVLEDKVDKIKFIAGSWHGQHKTEEAFKIESLKELNEILGNIQKAEGIDNLILSGDFNLPVEKAEKVVPGQFQIHKYKGIIRVDKNVIDFFITSKKFPLKELTAFEVETVGIEGILDHDISTGVANLTIEKKDD